MAKHTPHTAYIAIDFEGECYKLNKYRTCLRGVSEMGVAVIPPPVLQKPQTSRELLYGDDGSYSTARNPAAFPVPSMDLDTLLADEQIESYTFCIHQRTSDSRHKEKKVLSQPAWFDETKVDEKFEAFLASVHDRFNTEYAELTGTTVHEEHDSPIQLVLVGWSVAFECRVLCTQLVQSVSSGYLSAWCDISDIVTDTMSYPSPMIEALMALGYQFGDLVPFSRHRTHRAGNDTIRVLVILLHILHFSQTTGIIPPRVPRVMMKKRDKYNVDGTKRKATKGEHKFAQIPAAVSPMTSTDGTDEPLIPHPFQHPMRPIAVEKERHFKPGTVRPSPYADYPFTVLLQRWKDVSLRSVVKDNKELHNLFAEYNPTATALHTTRKVAWICLPDEGTRARFVVDTDKKERFGIVWKATSISTVEYGKIQSVQSFLRCERRAMLHDMRRPGNENLQEEQQAKRRAWRESLEEDPENNLSGGMGLLGLEDEY